MGALFSRLAPYLLSLVEALLILGTLPLIFFGRHTKSAASFRSLQLRFADLARRRTASLITIGLVVVIVRSALIPLLGIPSPRWDDEYSYLLAGKTFAMGRLTNPTPPMWVHFESFHIIMQPTYQSMYAPAQGVVLAIGIWLGNAWIGTLLVTAAACMALTWMLQAWVPPGWALFGGFLAVMRLGIMSYWMNSYWGTSIGALGGALVLGALPRLQKKTRIRDAIIMAVGITILANSRPYEGFVFSIPVAIMFFVWLSRLRGPHLRIAMRRIVLPIILVLCAAGGWMGYYFWRVTGNPFTMPYEVNRQTYAIAPYFMWQSLRPAPHYHHAEMADFYLNWERSEFVARESLSGLARSTFHKTIDLWNFYLGSVLLIPFFALPYVFRNRKMKFVLMASGFFLLMLIPETWTFPNYVTPATGLLYILLIQCFRYLRLWRWRGSPTGLALVRAVPAICVTMLVLRLVAIATDTPLEPRWPRGNRERVDIENKLEALPGNQLIIVEQGPRNIDKEWVYNEPDIPHAKVIWARNMSPSENQGLLKYFSDRRAWLLKVPNTPADPPLSLIPYPEQPLPNSASGSSPSPR